MNILLIDQNLGKQSNLSPQIPSNHIFKKKTAEKPDAVIVTDNLCYNTNLKAYDCKKYAWLIEPPIVCGENYINYSDIDSKFDGVFTYSYWLKRKTDKMIFVPHAGTWLRSEDIALHNKTKLCSTILSKKDWNAGHRHRLSIWERTKDKFNVDGYGSGCRNYVEQKIDGLKDYMFSIAMENEAPPFLFDQEVHYFSEKILDCFLSGTIPIYLGNQKAVSQYFNTDGIVFFDRIEQLHKILPTLTAESYHKRIDAVKENFEIAKKYIHPEDIIYKYLLENLNA
jgi:hypothetical protein